MRRCSSCATGSRPSPASGGPRSWPPPTGLAAGGSRRDVVPRPPWGGRLAQRLTAECLAFWGTDCHLCPDRSSPATTADHVIPRSKGGRDVLANLRPAHHACNVARRDLWLHQWFALHPLPAEPALPASRKW